jgi:hypothetical protein
MRLPPLKTEKAWHFSSWSVVGMRKSNGGVSCQIRFHFSKKYCLVCPCNIQGEPGCSTASLASFGHGFDRQARSRTSTRQLHCTGKHSGCDLLLIPIDICHSTTSLISLTHDSARQARLRTSTRHREALGLLPAPHPDRSVSLNNLGAVLYRRFSQTGQIEDVDEAIALHRERPRCSITRRTVGLSL